LDEFDEQANGTIASAANSTIAFILA
jgi:hypothetical protein